MRVLLNAAVEVAVDSDKPPFTFFGLYKGEDDENFIIEATHGDSYTGKIIYIPKRRIAFFVVLSEGGTR